MPTSPSSWRKLKINLRYNLELITLCLDNWVIPGHQGGSSGVKKISGGVQVVDRNADRILTNVKKLGD